MSTLAIATVKEFLEIGHTEQDTVVQAIIDGVEEYVEREAGIGLVASALIEDLKGGLFSLRPKIAPLNSVTSVERLASDDTLETVDATLYRIEGERVVRWDRVRWDRDTVFRLTYNGGHSTVPAGLKLALLQLVRRAYDNRGGKSQQAAQGFGVTWAVLKDSDVWKALRPYVAKGFVG